MIAKVTRGQAPSGAVRYLFGPGRYNEHEDPHVVAASASLRVEAGLRPTKAEVEELSAAMELPTVLFGTEVPGGACWHLSLSTKAGTDRESMSAQTDLRGRGAGTSGDGARAVIVRRLLICLQKNTQTAPIAMLTVTRQPCCPRFYGGSPEERLGPWPSCSVRRATSSRSCPISRASASYPS